MALTPAYAVNGGRVPAEMLRMTLWASTGGGNGIVTPTDLRVSALAVPGASVNVSPGGALLVNRFSGTSASQSYAAANDATVQVPIPATTSAVGRTDYIIMRINDWHYDGSQEPADPLSALYCSIERVSSIANLAYPFVPLAKIDIPASTGTITNAMITDLRQMAQTREKTVRRPFSQTSNETLQNSTTGEYWPNAGGQQLIDIPEWATRVQISAQWNSFYCPAGSVQLLGWVGFGDWDGTKYEITSQASSFDNASSANPSRGSLATNDEVAIPAKYRGRTNVPFQMWARKYNSSAVGARIDAWSNTLLEVRFLAVPDNAASS